MSHWFQCKRFEPGASSLHNISVLLSFGWIMSHSYGSLCCKSDKSHMQENIKLWLLTKLTIKHLAFSRLISQLSYEKKYYSASEHKFSAKIMQANHLLFANDLEYFLQNV